RNAYVAVWTIGDVSALASFWRGSPPWTDCVLGPGSRGPLAAGAGGEGGGAGSRRDRELAKSGLHEPHLVRVPADRIVHETGIGPDLDRPVGVRGVNAQDEPQVVRCLLLGELEAVGRGDYDDPLVRADDLPLDELPEDGEGHAGVRAVEHPG